MSEDARADGVSRQYDRWQYPPPVTDLDAWKTNHWDWFNPFWAHRLLWPDRDTEPTSTPSSRGAAPSRRPSTPTPIGPPKWLPSTSAGRRWTISNSLKDKHRPHNLELHRLAIEEVAALDRDFDLIVSTGVLHHLADPLTGLTALGRCLRPDGALGVMLYASYGRIGVEMLASVFRDLGLSQGEASVEMVKEAVAALPADYPVHTYLKGARDLSTDGVLVDTFLHARQRSYTVE